MSSLHFNRVSLAAGVAAGMLMGLCIKTVQGKSGTPNRCNRKPVMDGAALTCTEEQLEKMIEAAVEAKSNAYCPYSSFPVGSAVLTASGRIYAGCNVENACYGLTVCAERVALQQAVTAGDTEITAIVCVTNIKDKFKWPCGACRQCILEWGNGITVYSVTPDRRVRSMTIDELTPKFFSPADLDATRIAE